MWLLTVVTEDIQQKISFSYHILCLYYLINGLTDGGASKQKICSLVCCSAAKLIGR